jgi:YbbR domain-containing protein
MSFSLKNTLTKHVGLKLASLFLSLVVFVHVYTEQEREWSLDAPLDIIGVAQDLCFVSPPPKTVSVKVRGRGKDLIKLRLEGARAVVDVANAKAGPLKRVLSGSDIIIPPNLEVTVVDVVAPKVLDLELDSKYAKMIRVVPVYSGALAAGLALSGPPTVEPEQIQVTGPRRVLAGLDYINTLPIDISGMTAGSTVATDLDRDEMNLDLVPRSVKVTFALEKGGGGPQDVAKQQAAKDSG